MSHDPDQPFYNFQTVLDAVQYRVDDLVTTLLPGARKTGGSWRCGNASGERGSSFSIQSQGPRAGCFIDHSDPSVHGNAIGLWALVRGASYDEAGRALAAFLGVAPEPRLHFAKKRPAPKILKEEGKTTFICGGRTIPVRPLSQRSVSFAEGRGITAETLRKARCASTEMEIIFPHFDEEGNTVLIKCWACDGTKRMFTNDDPVPVLFAKHLVDPVKTGSTLIICEGQWDALTWIQLGYPAVSIPSGAGNHEWIGEDWNFLNRFSQIFLDYDNDAPGRAGELAVRTRLGNERCRSIHYGFKDANEALQGGASQVLHDAFITARDAPIERIVRPADVKGRVKDRLNRRRGHHGVPFFMPQLDVEFQPHEVVLWLGSTGHGKSSLLSNQICFAASRGKMCMVASFEQDSPMTIGAMLAQYTADPDIGQSQHFDAAYDDLTSKVLFYDSMERASPDDIIATIVLAHKQLGVTEFVVDNNMTLEVDRQDNTAQADVANKFRVVVARLPITLHLVVHPRKPKEDSSNKPPNVSDIMGASEWGNIAHKVICVWRDTVKAQRISEMRDEGMDALFIRQAEEASPDGKAFVRKQRETGDMPMVSYFYDRKIKRAYKTYDELAPYWSPPEEDPDPAFANPEPEPEPQPEPEPVPPPAEEPPWPIEEDEPF